MAAVVPHEMEEKIFVLSKVLPFMRRELGISVHDMVSLCVSCSQLAEEMEGYIVEEINRFPSVLTLSFHALGKGKCEIAFAKLDVGTRFLPTNTRFDHTVHFLIDPLDPRTNDFRPLDWTKEWNRIQNLKMTTEASDIDTWGIFWSKLLDYAQQNLFSNMKGRIRLEGDLQTLRLHPLCRPNPLCCPKDLDLELASMYESVSVNYIIEAPIEKPMSPKWMRRVYSSDNCAVVIDKDFVDAYKEDSDSDSDSDLYF